jgi:predicted DNA-binding transcriptional regulator YafY
MYGNRPTTRLLSMLELLQIRGRIGGPELARRLEVGERTVRRYAVTLQEMGVPVEGERGRYGAYSLKRGYKMPPLMFTDEEALGLALGLLAARTLGLVGVAPAVEGALAKLERVMPEALRGRVRNLEETVSIAIAQPATPADSETLLTLAAAGGMRLFRLDRVLEAEMLDDTFARPVRLESPGAVLSTLASTSGDEWSVEVLLETRAEDARWQLPSIGFALEQAEGGTLLRCSTWSLDWIARVLAGLDCSFIVRRPDELRDALERRAEKITTLSKRTERAAPS